MTSPHNPTKGSCSVLTSSSSPSRDWIVTMFSDSCGGGVVGIVIVCAKGDRGNAPSSGAVAFCWADLGGGAACCDDFLLSAFRQPPMKAFNLPGDFLVGAIFVVFKIT